MSGLTPAAACVVRARREVRTSRSSRSQRARTPLSKRLPRSSSELEYPLIIVIDSSACLAFVRLSRREAAAGPELGSLALASTENVLIGRHAS